MMTVTATFDLTILYFVAANIIAILSYVLIVNYRARYIKRNLAVISAAIMEYFRENGGEVGVECVSQSRGARFVALITSAPSKRFRHSNVVEVILRDHVRKTCGLELEKVYWCFPIKAKQDSPLREAAVSNSPATAESSDAYSKEGLSRLRKVPGYRVTETSLEKYEELVNQQRSNQKENLELT